MSEQFWLSDEQFECLALHFPRSRGKARVDDRRAARFDGEAATSIPPLIPTLVKPL